MIIMKGFSFLFFSLLLRFISTLISLLISLLNTIYCHILIIVNTGRVNVRLNLITAIAEVIVNNNSPPLSSSKIVFQLITGEQKSLSLLQLLNQDSALWFIICKNIQVFNYNFDVVLFCMIE